MAPARERIWLGAYVDRNVLEHVDGLASRLGFSRSHVIRIVMTHTDVNRVLKCVKLEAGAPRLTRTTPERENGGRSG